MARTRDRQRKADRRNEGRSLADPIANKSTRAISPSAKTRPVPQMGFALRPEPPAPTARQYLERSRLRSSIAEKASSDRVRDAHAKATAPSQVFDDRRPVRRQLLVPMCN